MCDWYNSIADNKFNFLNFNLVFTGVLVENGIFPYEYQQVVIVYNQLIANLDNIRKFQVAFICVYKSEGVCLIIMDVDSDSDISWLIQNPSLERKDANCNLDYQFIEEDIDLSGCDNNVVSLEENEDCGKVKVLYDNVVAEDMSSDENIDGM